MGFEAFQFVYLVIFSRRRCSDTTSKLPSVPGSLYFITKWLNNYSYRVEIGWWVFAITFLIAAVVVLATVSIHSRKASRINPVDALRYE